jgi:hypothetical protein
MPQTELRNTCTNIMAALCTQTPGLPHCEGWGHCSRVTEQSIFLGCGNVSGWVMPNISGAHSTIISSVTQSNKKHYLTLKMKAPPSFKTPRTTCPVTQPYIPQHCHLHNIAFWVLSKCLLPSGATAQLYVIITLALWPVSLNFMYFWQNTRQWFTYIPLW